jgi:hypothetical protein
MIDKPEQGGRTQGIKPLKQDIVARVAVKPKYRNPLFFLTTLIMVALCGYALWLSANGIFGKLLLIRGLRQIDTIVTTTQQLAANDRRVAETNNNDLIAALNSMGQLKSTPSVDGLQYVANPWGGHLTAKIMPNEKIWIETVVPPFACTRLIAMLGQPDAVTRAQTIQINAAPQLWLTIYSRADNTYFHESFVRANCRTGGEARIAILFNLYP